MSDPKTIAAAAVYDYDGDPRWSEFRNDVVVPILAASRRDVMDRCKLHFYKGFVDHDLVVEDVNSVRASAKSVSAPATENTSSLTAASTPETSAPPGRISGFFRLDKQRLEFILAINYWKAFAAAAIAVLPLVPSAVSTLAYRYSLLQAASASLHRRNPGHGMWLQFMHGWGL